MNPEQKQALDTAFDNYLAGQDVDSTLSDCAKFMFEAGVNAARVQQEPVAWSVVFNAVKQAIELCKNATGQHSTISRYVNAVQITHDALGTDTTNPAQPLKSDDLRQAALIDLAYINGAKAGWNMCVTDDESQFQKLTEGVAECVNVLKNTRSQATTQSVQSASCQYCDGTGDVHGIDGEWRGECNECTPAQPSYKERCQAEGWRAVSKTLDEVVPGWTEKAKTGMEAACNAIRELAQPVQPAGAQGEPVHFRAVLCSDQQNQAVGVVPKVVGFVDRKAAEQFILEKHDFQGWKYNLESLYTKAPAAALNEQLLEALNDFSNYVRTEQSSTDGQVQYSNTQINRLAFKARAAIAAAKAAKKGGV